MLRREQRVSDVLTRSGRPRRRAHARRLGASVAALATVLASGCGADPSTDGSTVAKATPPPELPSTRTRPPADNAIEPVAGGDKAADQTAATHAPTRAPQTDTDVHAILSAADHASFSQLAASLSGVEGLAVSRVGLNEPVERAGALRTGIAWSTGKVPLAMAVIANGTGSEEANLRAAITASDNAAAMRLWKHLDGADAAAAAADEQLREAGDVHTSIESRTLRDGYTPFGQTRWSLADQARFTAGMACTYAGAQALRLMDEVVTAQRWGLGAAGAPAQFKGGWGPGAQPGVGGGYLDRQMGVLKIQGRPLAVAIATQPGDGSHDTGTRNLTTIARWLVDHVNAKALRDEPSC